MGFFLTDPFTHTSMAGLIEKRAEKTVFRTEAGDQQVIDPWTNQVTWATLYDCYHYVLDAPTASTVDSAWRIPVVAGDVAVVSFWTLPTAGHWVLKTDFFHEDTTTNTWSKVPDTYSSLQYIAVGPNISTIAQLDGFISSQLISLDAFYGTHTSPTDYDTCFYRSDVWLRTQMPEWTSVDSACETCGPGTGNAPLKILIYKWTKGSDVEYRSSTNCPTTNNCCQLTSTDLVLLQSQLTSELLTRSETLFPQGCEQTDTDTDTDMTECVSDINCEEGFMCINGACIERIEGCTDGNSREYDSASNTDNGSCISCVEGYIKDDEGLCTNCDVGYKKNTANNCISEEEEGGGFNWMLAAVIAGVSVIALS